MKVKSLRSFSKAILAIIMFIFCFQAIHTVTFAEEISENRTVDQALKEAEKQKEDESDAGNETQMDNELNVEESPLELQEEPSLVWSFIKLIGALAFVIIIMFVLLRLFSGRSRAFRANKTIENIGGVSLGANRSVQIVRVGDRVLIVGVGENVQLLKELDKDEEVEKLLEKHEQEIERLDVPITKLSNWLGGRTSGQKSERGKREVEFGTMLKQQLDDVSESQKKVHEAMKEQKR